MRRVQDPKCCCALVLSRARRRAVPGSPAPGRTVSSRFGVWAHCSAASLVLVREARRARNAIGRDGRCGPGRMPSDRAGRLKDVHVVSLRSRSGRVRSLPTVTLRGSTRPPWRPLTGGPGRGRGAPKSKSTARPGRTVPALSGALPPGLGAFYGFTLLDYTLHTSKQMHITYLCGMWSTGEPLTVHVPHGSYIRHVAHRRTPNEVKHRSAPRPTQTRPASGQF